MRIALILAILVFLLANYAIEIADHNKQITAMKREISDLRGQVNDTVKTMYYLTDPDTIQDRTIKRLVGGE